MKPLTLSVVVPCFNERETLHELHRRVSEVCRACVGRNYELVLVNDGSTDGTWDLLAILAARDPHVVAVNLSRNHGHQLALSAGLHLCRGGTRLQSGLRPSGPPGIAGSHDGADG